MTNRENSPNLYIIAGPNGAGKTTFATEFLPLYAKCNNFVNADLISKGLAPFGPEKAAIKAGRILLEQIHNLSAQKVDFAFETTLAGKTYIPFLKRLKTAGYTIHLFFLWVPNIDLALGRIKDRVAQGGHDVPEEDVKRRFNRSFNNFINVYKPLADIWTIFDNSAVPPKAIVVGSENKTEIFNQERFHHIFPKG